MKDWAQVSPAYGAPRRRGKLEERPCPPQVHERLILGENPVLLTHATRTGWLWRHPTLILVIGNCAQDILSLSLNLAGLLGVWFI